MSLLCSASIWNRMDDNQGISCFPLFDVGCLVHAIEPWKSAHLHQAFPGVPSPHGNPTCHVA
jgi:hypothetical protein